MTSVEATRVSSASDPPKPRAAVLPLLAVAQLMLVLDVTVVNVALPDIGSGLELGTSAIAWVMTSYTLAFGGLMLLGGRVADLVGPRRSVVTGLIVFTAASVLSGAAQNPVTLLSGRALQGVGAAILSPAALALVLAAHTGPHRSRAMGVWGALSGLGSALGVVLGGALTSAVGWRWIFMINLPIGLGILLALPLVVTRQPRPARVDRLDVPGAVLVTAATGAAIYGLTDVAQHGWDSAGTLLPLAGALMLYLVFAAVERRTAAPLLTIALLARRPVAAGAFLMLVATALMVGGFFLGSFSLQRVSGYSALHVGLAFLPVSVAVVTGAHLAGRVLGRTPATVVAVTGLALAAIGDGAAALWTGPLITVVGLTVAALGIGATFVTAFTTALADAAAATAGLRSAVVSTFHELGGTFGVAVLASVASSSLGALPAAHNFGPAFAVAAIAAGAAAVVAGFLVPAITRPPAEAGHHH